MKLVKRALKTGAKALIRWLSEDQQNLSQAVPFDNSYGWLGENFLKFMKDPLCAKNPGYIWGVLQGAALSKILGLKRISVIEFGVAGGRGLLAMERTAELVEDKTDIGIDVYGFDAEYGLPRPEDYRDLPNIFFGGQFPMDRTELEKRLRRAQLKLGLVEEAIPDFLASNPAPIAFVSIDVDLYSSTMQALKVFEESERLLLPRVFCYFDDVLGFTFSDFNGERLAISEFNTSHSVRKFSPIYGLKYYIPQKHRSSSWPEKFFLLHVFDHALYNHPDSRSKPMRIDIDGTKVQTTNDHASMSVSP